MSDSYKPKKASRKNKKKFLGIYEEVRWDFADLMFCVTVSMIVVSIAIVVLRWLRG